MVDAASQRTTVRTAGAGSGRNSGGETPIREWLWVNQLVATQVAASEDRIMREVTEKTSALEKELLSKMSEVSGQVAAIKPGATWAQNAVLVVGGIGVVFGILAFASDRFDGGLAASSIRDDMLEAQEKVDALQNERIDRVIELLEAQPKGTPSPD